MLVNAVCARAVSACVKTVNNAALDRSHRKDLPLCTFIASPNSN
jgi:hypothetical protein